MGKIRTTVIGSEEELKSKKQKEVKREQKKLRDRGKVTAVSGTETPKTELPATPSSKKTKVAKKRLAKSKSRRYLEARKLVDKKKTYPLSEAFKLLPKISLTSFDPSVEVHVNCWEKVSGLVLFPHGTGKTLRIKIADEELIKKIAQGIIDFDVLIASPSLMPNLAKVAKILGPKGLMPNPKAGTISVKPEEAVKKLSQGQVPFKTESEVPIIHLVIGKLSFGEKKLTENLLELVRAINKIKIKSLYLKTTMSPSLKVEPA